MSIPGEGATQKTIRQMVVEIRNEIRDTDLQPDRAAELKTKLSAIYGNILDHILLTEGEYTKVYLKALQEESKANRAKIVAETSPEYMLWQAARNTKAEVDKMISSLSSFLRQKEDEMRFTQR